MKKTTISCLENYYFISIFLSVMKNVKKGKTSVIAWKLSKNEIYNKNKNTLRIIQLEINIYLIEIIIAANKNYFDKSDKLNCMTSFHLQWPCMQTFANLQVCSDVNEVYFSSGFDTKLVQNELNMDNGTLNGNFFLNLNRDRYMNTDTYFNISANAICISIYLEDWPISPTVVLISGKNNFCIFHIHPEIGSSWQNQYDFYTCRIYFEIN